MEITGVEFSYSHRVLHKGFAMDFSNGINVFIGGNGTGKTTLLKYLFGFVNLTHLQLKGDFGLSLALESRGVKTQDNETLLPPVYIPEKDILSIAKGLPETCKYGRTDLDLTDIAIIEQARVPPQVPEQPLYREICDFIGGEPEHNGESFFMERFDIYEPIPFSHEASGYRKLGLLALLVRNEQIKPGTILFWDEPENSLNPEIMPKLVEILLKLQREGVQIFLATHSEILASYICTLRKSTDHVKFFSLYKEKRQHVKFFSLCKEKDPYGYEIKYDSSERFDLLRPNTLTAEKVKLYEAKLEKGLGSGREIGDDDE